MTLAGYGDRTFVPEFSIFESREAPMPVRGDLAGPCTFR